MKKKNPKEIKSKKIYLVYVFILLIAIICIIQIFAVFQSEVEGSINLEKGVWQIEVNGTDISNGVNKEFIVNNIEIQNNEHVKPGNLAPGLSGIFNISINPENTDVSVRYDVSLNEESLTNKNITIKSITETVQGNSLIKTGENVYTGIITLDDINQGIQNNIKVEIEWIDNEEYNEEDINMGTQEDYKLEIPIVVHVTQYLGEVIETYE